MPTQEELAAARQRIQDRIQTIDQQAIGERLNGASQRILERTQPQPVAPQRLTLGDLAPQAQPTPVSPAPQPVSEPAPLPVPQPIPVRQTREPVDPNSLSLTPRPLAPETDITSPSQQPEAIAQRLQAARDRSAVAAANRREVLESIKSAPMSALRSAGETISVARNLFGSIWTNFDIRPKNYIMQLNALSSEFARRAANTERWMYESGADLLNRAMSPAQNQSPLLQLNSNEVLLGASEGGVPFSTLDERSTNILGLPAWDDLSDFFLIPNAERGGMTLLDEPILNLPKQIGTGLLTNEPLDPNSANPLTRQSPRSFIGDAMIQTSEQIREEQGDLRSLSVLDDIASPGAPDGRGMSWMKEAGMIGTDIAAIYMFGRFTPAGRMSQRTAQEAEEIYERIGRWLTGGKAERIHRFNRGLVNRGIRDATLFGSYNAIHSTLTGSGDASQQMLDGAVAGLFIGSAFYLGGRVGQWTNLVLGRNRSSLARRLAQRYILLDPSNPTNLIYQPSLAEFGANNITVFLAGTASHQFSNGLQSARQNVYLGADEQIIADDELEPIDIWESMAHGLAWVLGGFMVSSGRTATDIARGNRPQDPLRVPIRENVAAETGEGEVPSTRIEVSSDITNEIARGINETAEPNMAQLRAYAESLALDLLNPLGAKIEDIQRMVDRSLDIAIENQSTGANHRIAQLNRDVTQVGESDAFASIIDYAREMGVPEAEIQNAVDSTLRMRDIGLGGNQGEGQAGPYASNMILLLREANRRGHDLDLTLFGNLINRPQQLPASSATPDTLPLFGSRLLVPGEVYVLRDSDGNVGRYQILNNTVGPSGVTDRGLVVLSYQTAKEQIIPDHAWGFLRPERPELQRLVNNEMQARIDHEIANEDLQRAVDLRNQAAQEDMGSFERANLEQQADLLFTDAAMRARNALIAENRARDLLDDYQNNEAASGSEAMIPDQFGIARAAREEESDAAQRRQQAERQREQQRENERAARGQQRTDAQISTARQKIRQEIKDKINTINGQTQRLHQHIRDLWNDNADVQNNANKLVADALRRHSNDSNNPDYIQERERIYDRMNDELADIQRDINTAQQRINQLQRDRQNLKAERANRIRRANLEVPEPGIIPAIERAREGIARRLDSLFNPGLNETQYSRLLKWMEVNPMTQRNPGLRVALRKWLRSPPEMLNFFRNEGETYVTAVRRFAQSLRELDERFPDAEGVRDLVIDLLNDRPRDLTLQYLESVRDRYPEAEDLLRVSMEITSAFAEVASILANMNVVPENVLRRRLLRFYPKVFGETTTPGAEGSLLDIFTNDVSSMRSPGGSGRFLARRQLDTSLFNAAEVRGLAELPQFESLQEVSQQRFDPNSGQPIATETGREMRPNTDGLTLERWQRATNVPQNLNFDALSVAGDTLVQEALKVRTQNMFDFLRSSNLFVDMNQYVDPTTGRFDQEAAARDGMVLLRTEVNNAQNGLIRDVFRNQFADLADKVIPAEIANVINNIDAAHGPMRTFMQGTLQTWKAFNTIGNLPTHMRNVYSMVFGFNLWAGHHWFNPRFWTNDVRIALQRYTDAAVPEAGREQAIRDLFRKHRQNSTQEMEDMFVDAALRNNINPHVLEAMVAVDLTGMYNATQLRSLGRIRFPESMEDVGRFFSEVSRIGQMITSGAREIARAANRTYQFEEVFWKFLHYDRLRNPHLYGSSRPAMGIVEAARHTNARFPNYSNAPRIVRSLGRWTHPFVSFAVEDVRIRLGHLGRSADFMRRASGLSQQSFWSRPWSEIRWDIADNFMPGFVMAITVPFVKQLMNSFAEDEWEEQTGLDREVLRRSTPSPKGFFIPPQLGLNSWFGYDDDNLIWMDLGNLDTTVPFWPREQMWLLDEIRHGDSASLGGWVARTGGSLFQMFFANPALRLGIETGINESIYSEKEIRDPIAPATTQAMQWGFYAANFMLPNFLVGGARRYLMSLQENPETGQPYTEYLSYDALSPNREALRNFLGVNITAINPEKLSGELQDMDLQRAFNELNRRRMTLEFRNQLNIPTQPFEVDEDVIQAELEYLTELQDMRNRLAPEERGNRVLDALGRTPPAQAIPVIGRILFGSSESREYENNLRERLDEMEGRESDN